MRTRNGSRNSNPLVCSFTQNVCTIRGNRTHREGWGWPKLEIHPLICQLHVLEIPRFPNTSNSRKAREYSTTEYNRVLLSLWFWKFNQCKLYWGYFAWRTEGMKKKKGFQNQFIFNLEIYLHLPDVGTTLVQYFFFFFGIEQSSFSIQTNFLSHSQLGMIWLGLGSSSSRARSVEMGGIFLGICLSLAEELKGYEKEARRPFGPWDASASSAPHSHLP